MFRPETIQTDDSGHRFMSRKQNIVGGGVAVTLETMFSAGWTSSEPYTVRLFADKLKGYAFLGLAVNEATSEYLTLLSNAKQETPKSAKKTLNELITAQHEEGAGLDAPLSVHTEHHMARLAMAHIIEQRGFTLTDRSLISQFITTASAHIPTERALNHDAFQSVRAGVLSCTEPTFVVL
ncbi:MAG: hypothetical protein M3Q70_02280 [bacterium]|nr:hypothetical protein [bacterium]